MLSEPASLTLCLCYAWFAPALRSSCRFCAAPRATASGRPSVRPANLGNEGCGWAPAQHAGKKTQTRTREFNKSKHNDIRSSIWILKEKYFQWVVFAKEKKDLANFNSKRILENTILFKTSLPRTGQSLHRVCSLEMFFIPITWSTHYSMTCKNSHQNTQVLSWLISCISFMLPPRFSGSARYTKTSAQK